MTILTMYDVTGIQKFIFLSNKLKENVGASIIVARVLQHELVEAVRKICRAENMACVTDWQNNGGFAFLLSDTQMGAEVIYIGGGKAMVAYRDETLAQKVTRELSRNLIEMRGLNLVVAYQATDLQNFAEDYEALGRKLDENSRNAVFSEPLSTFAVTRLGVTDGYPVEKRYEGDYLSHLAICKRKIARGDDYFRTFLIAGYNFPLEIDKMGQTEGNSHAAFVHVDGNGMRQLIQTILTQEADYLQAILRMRSLSRKIAETYREGFVHILQRLVAGFQDGEFFERFHLQRDEDNGNLYLPIRPLILNGDDVTFACHGSLGIALSELYLQYIATHPLEIESREYSLSACAGVTIVNTGFPFYRAYGLAESLCKSAKAKARIHGSDRIGNWIDFHINYGGVTGSLDQIRAHDYNVPYRPVLPPEKSKNGQLCSRYHLLWRPWCIEGEAPEQFQWRRFREAYRELKSWPRNRLKKLRNTFLHSEEELLMTVEQFKSKGKELPEFCGTREVFRSLGQTPWFDMLDLLELYEELPGENSDG